MTYTVLKGCAWTDPKSGASRAWAKGGTLADGDVPPDVLKALVRQKAVAPDGAAPPAPPAAGG